MQKEQVNQLRDIALKVVKDAHKFPSDDKYSVYTDTRYPEFSITVQNKSLEGTEANFNVWFVYNLVTPYGVFQPSIKFRFTPPEGLRLQSNYVKHFNLDTLLPIYSYIIEKYEL